MNLYHQTRKKRELKSSKLKSLARERVIYSARTDVSRSRHTYHEAIHVTHLIARGHDPEPSNLLNWTSEAHPSEPPLDSPTVFWRDKLLCVVQEDKRVAARMRTCDPRSGKWGKPVAQIDPETPHSISLSPNVVRTTPSDFGR